MKAGNRNKPHIRLLFMRLRCLSFQVGQWTSRALPWACPGPRGFTAPSPSCRPVAFKAGWGGEQSPTWDMRRVEACPEAQLAKDVQARSAMLLPFSVHGCGRQGQWKLENLIARYLFICAALTFSAGRFHCPLRCVAAQIFALGNSGGSRLVRGICSQDRVESEGCLNWLQPCCWSVSSYVFWANGDLNFIEILIPAMGKVASLSQDSA